MGGCAARMGVDEATDQLSANDSRVVRGYGMALSAALAEEPTKPRAGNVWTALPQHVAHPPTARVVAQAATEAEALHAFGTDIWAGANS